MNNETVDALLKLLQSMIHNSQEDWLKVTALERTVQMNPSLLEKYEQFHRKLQTDPTVLSSNQRTAKALQDLRAKLLQDQ